MHFFDESLNDNQIVAEGFTQRVRGHHAEVMALSSYHSEFDGDLDEIVAYVTLEPLREERPHALND
ncbi:hypothetical protein [uncultured Shewanella sp.]|uniref:hypothetical protein n=1 Tax=uncultured Shewanella sp. TaxID=173975 RepID=UPI0026297A79|nr:hypothetical protein [uncultured Shewanella sp.]